MQSSTLRIPVCALALLLAGVSPGSPAQEELPDWVSRDQLDPEQLERLNPACCGMFVEPQRDDEYADLDPETAPTIIDAPSGLEQPHPGELRIHGPLRLLQGYRSIDASERADLNEEAQTAELHGNIRFREPGILLTGESALIDDADNRAILNQSRYVFHETGIHGRADRLSMDNDTGRITIDNGEFSRCEPGDEFWILQARSLDLDPEAGIGYARSVTLRMRDVPVFYYPYTVPFPISDQRVSGLLAPGLSNSRRGGLDIALPYYFNLAPHYDATITPRLIQERGAMLGAEFRYLSRWSMDTINATTLPDDGLYNAEEAAAGTGDSPQSRNRWLLAWDHEGRIDQNWSTRVDYTAVSDRDYFRDLGSRGLDLENRTHLNRQGQLRYRNDGWQAEANVQRIELIDPFLASIDVNKPYDRMPELQVGARFQEDIGIEWGFDSSLTRFDRSLNRNRLSQEQLDAGALVTGQRLSLEPQISLPWRTAGSFLVPTARYRYAQWDLDQQAIGTEPRPDRGIAVFSLDSGLIFDRPVEFAGENMTQTLEPRLYYLYSEFEDQSELPLFDSSQRRLSFNQLFRHDRFNGQDRAGDANQLSAAVSTRFFNNAGREVASASLGQIFHFRDRRVSPDSLLQEWIQFQPMDDSRSAFVAEGHYALADNWSLRSDIQWSEERGTIDEGSFAFRYEHDEQRLVNLAYRYRERADPFPQSPAGLDPRIRQTDLSAAWPVNENWRLFGRWNYDHSNRRNLETFAGVEYSNCCATMRVLLRDWVNDYEFLDTRARQNRGIYVQLTLHGLGSLTGSGISNLLTEGIPGFKEQAIP